RIPIPSCAFPWIHTTGSMLSSIATVALRHAKVTISSLKKMCGRAAEITLMQESLPIASRQKSFQTMAGILESHDQDSQSFQGFGVLMILFISPTGQADGRYVMLLSRGRSARRTGRRGVRGLSAEICSRMGYSYHLSPPTRGVCMSRLTRRQFVR